ncbi:MAG: VOC family protein [Rhizobiaceae bacterium]|nr:VOC family protein [Rhizobiaceae bacterium]
MRFIPYLSFDGNCREAFAFYQRVLGGEIKAMISHGETPIADQVPPDWKDRIINAYLVAEGAELMGADSPPGSAAPTGFSLSIMLDDEARARRVFSALAEGGTIIMPLEPTFWAAMFGMVTDRYGTPWMINCGMVDQNA